MDLLEIIFACFSLAGFGRVFLWLANDSITTGRWDNDTWYILAGIAFFYLMMFLVLDSMLRQQKNLLSICSKVIRLSKCDVVLSLPGCRSISLWAHYPTKTA
jgi:hypothetical protein